MGRGSEKTKPIKANCRMSCGREDTKGCEADACSPYKSVELEILLCFAFSYEGQCPEPQQCNRRRFGNRHGTAKAAAAGFVAG